MSAPAPSRASVRPAVIRGAPRRRRRLGRLICALLLGAPLAALCGSAWLVSSRANVQDWTRTDAIVVLGAAQFDGRPSEVLHARLSHGLELYRSGIAPLIVTVGGRQPGDRYTEATAGRDWLVRNGVPWNAVVPISTGSDTASSLLAVAERAQERNLRSVTLVSDPAHMARSQAMAARYGFDARVNPTDSGPNTEVTPSYLARETGGLLRFAVIDQWSQPQPVHDAHGG